MTAISKGITCLLSEESGLNYTVIMQTAGRHILKKMSVKNPKVEIQPGTVSMQSSRGREQVKKMAFNVEFEEYNFLN